MYNGWSNWETWNTYTWLSNEEFSYKVAKSHADDADNFKDFVENYIWDNANGLGNIASLAQDLLTSTIQEINFEELRQAFLPESDEEWDFRNPELVGINLQQAKE